MSVPVQTIRVTSLVDAELSDLYDEIMAADPATRTAAQERFIEYVGERLVDEVEPRCDICGRREDDSPSPYADVDWNGETGNHRTCEESDPTSLMRLGGAMVKKNPPDTGPGGMPKEDPR